MKDSMADYPECEKLLAATDRSQTCGELLEWLRSQGIHLMQYRPTIDRRPCPVCYTWGPLRHDHEQCGNCLADPGYVNIEFEAFVEDGRTIEQLLADFFGIDMAKADVERRAMLAALRAANDWSASEA